MMMYMLYKFKVIKKDKKLNIAFIFNIMNILVNKKLNN